jgi:putrescine aminotransferase
MTATHSSATITRAERYAWHHGAQDDTYWTRRHRMIVRGEGIHVFDEDGKRYIDGTSGQAAVQIGHGNAEMAEAIATQARQLGFSPMAFGFSHPLPGELGERLATLTPGDLTLSWFACTGSEAVETAIKLARQAQARLGRPERKKIIGRRGSYHGVTYGALSVTATTRLRAPSEPLVPGFRHVAQPYPRTCAFCAAHSGCTLDCADDLERMIEFEGPETVAAFIAEPIAQPETVKIPREGYWQRIREICDRHGVLLIADEVFNGFGRTGRMFASEHFDLVPDVMTMSKGLSSGYAPISATIASARIAALFDSPANAFQHAGTYSGHPVGCAAALKNIEILERDALPENAAVQGERMRDLLQPLERDPAVRALNIKGLLIAIELQADDELGAPSSFGPKVRDAAYERGLICRFAPTSIGLYPPLILSDADTEEIADILLASFAAVREGR